MHWTTICSLLTCGLLSAYLAFVRGLPGSNAMLVVGISILPMCCLVFGIAYLLAESDEKGELIRGFRNSARRDFEALLKIVTFTV